jgi:hypothetical protein
LFAATIFCFITGCAYSLAVGGIKNSYPAVFRDRSFFIRASIKFDQVINSGCLRVLPGGDHGRLINIRSDDFCRQFLLGILFG